jgi:predicted nucleic acid-binding protein
MSPFFGRNRDGHALHREAAYLALAEALDAPLLTCDRKLASIPGHAATVAVVGDR